MAFAINVIFDSKETFDIGDSTVISTIITKKSQFFDINIKNRNKNKKIIERPDAIIIILVNFIHIFNITKAVYQFLKLVFIL